MTTNVPELAAVINIGLEFHQQSKEALNRSFPE
jgi:hypothetical protein